MTSSTSFGWNRPSFDWKRPAVLITGKLYVCMTFINTVLAFVLGFGAASGIAVGIYFTNCTTITTTTSATMTTPWPDTTESLTTAPPTSEPPTTESPTMEPPTTVPRTAEAPTTESPTTVPPTMEPPTTAPPTTEPPTTESPTTVSEPDEVPIKLPDGTEIIANKGEWTEWETTTCSVSCGDGQQTVQRSCRANDASLDTVVCDAVNGTFESFQFEIVECDNPVCTIGRTLVEDTIRNLKKSLSSNHITFDDKEFLKRYAESVTDYGNTINDENNSGGHGIWRIIDTDAKLILQVIFLTQLPSMRTMSDRILYRMRT